ncbi:fibrinogen C domain-containing protein 1 isoform X2 [Stomoxys calcitrans]|uniref:fibrinogen C domain-containing protein 1 isoform X2 n=1 Tax=Stomoxys calcitrans TaxID=35570 RepID=UPI0027E24E35|nr:fibrinogen C domain-containing protein 1 isoform X2 [Stomoxys calcitrans]
MKCTLNIFLVVWCLGCAISTNSTNSKDYLDLYNGDDQIIIIQSLFMKINSLLIEINNTNQRLGDMEKRLVTQNSQIRNLHQAVDLQKNQLTESQTEINKRLGELSEGNAWITILKRFDGSVDFYRSWQEYKDGFGKPPNGEFFIGLTKLYRMTSAAPYELLIELRDWDDEMRYAHYDHFKIGSEREKYKLKILGSYSGDAKDALSRHRRENFATFDEDSDQCAHEYRGAWWFYNCYSSHLFGPYRNSNVENPGMSWDKWRNDYSLKTAEMKIRKKSL